MRDEQIKQKIASFPRWHYRFDLKGNPTPIWQEEFINRHEQRKKYFFDPLVQLFGGSLAGKRVLDLGCNAGFWSLAAVRAGCDYVLGIDGRQMHIDQANFVFEVEEIERDRYDFVTGDLFASDLREFGRFDIVLCFGLMYHVSKHVDLMEKMEGVSDDVLLVDTALSKLPGSCLEFRRDLPDDPRSAVDRKLVMAPTWEAMRDLAQEFGYEVAVLKPDFDDYEGSKDYRRRRRAFLCAKHTDIQRARVEIEIEPPKMRPARQGRGKSGRQPVRASSEMDAREIHNLKGWMRQTDLALLELFSSRRWRLANAVGDVGRRILRKERGPTAEDRLLAIRNEFRDWARKSGENQKRGTQGPKKTQ